jgi:hypothetical protein
MGNKKGNKKPAHKNGKNIGRDDVNIEMKVNNGGQIMRFTASSLFEAENKLKLLQEKFN